MKARPWFDYRWLLGVAAVIAALAVASLAAGQFSGNGASAEDRAVVTCRAVLAAAVTDASVDNDLAENALVTELASAITADRQVTLDDAIAELVRTGRELDRARDARVGYEANPNPDCTGGR